MASFQKYRRIAFFILLLVSTTIAAREGAFPLFQSDTGKLVQDLLNGNTYEEIYFQYHGCVWSEYGNGADQLENGCEGDGSGDNWYMGRTQCFRANVAYSLYGVSKHEETPKNPCRKKNFINSYFTTLGVDQFADSMGMNDGSVSSYCEYISGGEDGNQYSSVINNNAMLYEDFKSATTACSADGRFVQGLFKGAYCSVREVGTNLDEMESFNQMLEDMTCVPVLGSYSGRRDRALQEGDNEGQGQNQAEGNDGPNEGDNEGQGQEGNNNNDNQQNKENNGQSSSSSSSLVNVLAYSEPCSTLEYPKQCVDPFNAKASFDYHPAKSLPWWQNLNWMDKLSGVFLFFALLFALIPFCDGEDDDDEDQPKKRRGLCWRRRRPRNQDENDGNDSNQKKRGFRSWFRKKILRRSN